MKIVAEYESTYQTKVIAVESAEYLGDFTIRITFSDSITHSVDFKIFLESSSHPAIRKYLNEDQFKQYEIKDGNLNWNNYELIFPLADLYSGKL
jgi:hypothetical protein